ncbi:MAG: histone deacetylase [Sphingobacteriales bacterium]|uniref:histone deacetylase family protein n=1 Tax=Hydrotalea flava TaxID=714549 RepID=UPI0008345B38|nr:histone deacetylase [Hydrotalea flava]RTL54864.1 MAG: histone deacetylase [Sphingobacteriales bacterium]
MIQIAYHPLYAHALPAGHRFPMEKYELIPAQLLHEGTITSENLFSMDEVSDTVVLLTHDAEYVQKLKTQTLTAAEERKIGFPQSPALTKREWLITQGTILCCYSALQNGIALNVAGGTHHAFKDHGEGFCLLNDFAVAAHYLLQQKLAKQILIIDVDVHQGNGTASIFNTHPEVFTFSMHGAHNYPFHKEISDIDLPLADGTDDKLYLKLLQEALLFLLPTVKPDFIFYLSGVDILNTDKYGKLNISIAGCKKRDELVFKTLKQQGIPVVVAMGGGYSPHIRTIIEAHCNTFRTALHLY